MGRLRLAAHDRFSVVSAPVVRDRIARIILGEPGDDPALGPITLHPHQLSAVQRLLIALDRFNGALLCDDVGMGKTYVAIDIAKRFKRCLVVAPAALTYMWRAAQARTRTHAELVTFEALSRADASSRSSARRVMVSQPVFDLVVIDEAHHVRNPRTNRFFALESLVKGAKVLMLSATPIHNRRQDLVALLSLFLGSRARALTSAELALCIVRRDHQHVEQSVRIPRILPAAYHEVGDDPGLVEQLMDLPPPVPPRDGGVAAALVGRGLVHLWASSGAAFHEALTKRIARATALCVSLETGTYPTAKELETWIYGEGALQLAFAELLSAPSTGHGDLLSAVRTHLGALRRIRAHFGPPSLIDARRAQIVAALKTSQAGNRVVAFAQYSETISMLFRSLVHTGRVAMLTSHGARVAGGSLTRTEAIARFAPLATGRSEPPSAERIDLLLTTDLLSEGVNLQDAATVIHIDIPWTIARMEQRVGRVARLGSAHDQVSVHTLRPPRSAETVVGGESIVERKWQVTTQEVGTSAARPDFQSMVNALAPESETREAEPQKVERLRGILERWIALDAGDCSSKARECDIAPEQKSRIDRAPSPAIVATVESSKTGFISAVSTRDVPQLLIGAEGRVTTDLSTQVVTCAAAEARESPTNLIEAERVAEMIHEWNNAENASAAAGLASSNALRRREITGRIDAAIVSAPPHLRAARLRFAERARVVATTPQCAAIERELQALMRSGLPDDEWLRTIADLEKTAGRPKTPSTDPLTIHAILILRPGAKPPRSPSPLAPESP